MEPGKLQIRKLDLQRVKFQNIIKNINEALTTDVEENEVESFKSLLTFNAKELDQAIVNALEVTDDDKGYADLVQQQVSVDDQLIGTIRSLDTKLNQLRAASVTRGSFRASTPVPGVQPKNKLPEIHLPTFDGKVECWSPFWDQFRSLVHDRQDVQKVIKFNYLKGQLSGHPLQLLQGFSVTDINYDQAVQLLKVTYENPDRMRYEFTKKLMAIKRPQNKVGDLMQFRADLESVLRSLENLNCDISQGDWFLSVVVTEKLPSQVVEIIQRRVDSDYPTLLQIREHLVNVINSLATSTSHQTETHASGSKPSHAPHGKSSSASSGKSFQATSGKSNSYGKANEGQAKTNNQSSPKWSASVAQCTTSKSESSSARQQNCLFCKGNHRPTECGTYQTKEQRQQQLKKIGRCINCCKAHDPNIRCELKECFKCGEGKHHTFLCEKTLSPKTTVAPAVSRNETTALPIASIGVVRRKTTTTHKALLDTGSQRTFIISSLADKLDLKPISKIQLKVAGFLPGSETKTYDVVNLTLKMGRQFYRVKALVTDYMPSRVTIHGLTDATKHLRSKVNLNCPDPQSDEITEIEVLIGMDQYYKIVKGQSKVDGIGLMHTAGGQIVAGNLPARFTPSNTSLNVAIVARVDDCTPPIISESPQEIMNKVEELWSLETLGIKPENDTPEERWVQEEFENSVIYRDNQYWVRLPWRRTHPQLDSNYSRCYSRTKRNYENLKKDSTKLQAYHDVLDKQLESKFVEEVPHEQENKEAHYLPQLCVDKDSKTTPLRVVYDCSAKTNNGVSLNDCLYSGPSLVEELGRVMIRFRTNELAYTADISKAFLRVGLLEQDRDFTRFLAPHSYGVFDPPTELRFKSVLFGSTSSPYLLQAVLNYHLTVQHKDHPYASIIRNSLYVDNLQGTTDSEADLEHIYHSAHDLLKGAAMPLQEWYSNSEKLKQIIIKDYPDEERESKIKVLGSYWDTDSDQISISPVNYTEVRTKRDLLSNCSKLYDPLGLITPITIQFRILMQETWKLKLHWDESLPESILNQWQTCLKNAAGTENIEFPRTTCFQNLDYELHIFCDASPKAYGAVAYLVNPQQEPRLLTSKSRVAPLVQKTLPQLELSAILVGSRLANYITSTLSHINILQTVIWTDSQVALAWVTNNRSNIVYVRNRVMDIHKEQPHLNLQHVSSKENPADLLTKAQSVNQLINNPLWLHGPEWLQYKPIRMNPCIAAPTVAQLPTRSIMDHNKYSSLKKLLNVTAFVFKAVKIWRPTFEPPDPLMYWVKVVQQAEFASEYATLASGLTKTQPPNIQTAPLRSKPLALIKDLRLYMHDEIIRTNGRIDNATLPHDTKQPILLPKKSHLTNLIINHHHIQNLHSGVNQTLASIRQNYWIPQGRQQIKNQIKNCKLCVRFEGARCPAPPSPSLPVERVQDAKPFQIVGVDYSGAITLKHEGESIKTYVCLFTCATTRAVHLELAEDLSAETFVNLFRRFIARRSCPELIISDNATNFRAGADFLLSLAQDSEVQNQLEKLKVKWKFIPPQAPWFGGFYERLIGLVKGCLRKCLYRRQISLSELQTILAEIEARINNRPLTYQTDCIDDLEPLTPNHLIYGRTIQIFPLMIKNKGEEYLPQAPSHEQLNLRLAYLNRIISHWHKVWKTDYLTSLRERYPKKGEKPQSFTQNLKIGDICLVHGNTGREQWPLGKIIEIYPDKHGHIRVVKLKTARGEIIRAIKHIYPLEITPGNACSNEPARSQSENKESDLGQANSSPPTSRAPAQLDPDINPESGPPINDDGQGNYQPKIGENLDIKRSSRRAAQECRKWLKGVCQDELSE